MVLIYLILSCAFGTIEYNNLQWKGCFHVEETSNYFKICDGDEVLFTFVRCYDGTLMNTYTFDKYYCRIDGDDYCLVPIDENVPFFLIKTSQQ